MMKPKINTSIFCFLEKQGACNTLCDANCSDDERAAQFAAAEKKKYEKEAHKQREMVHQKYPSFPKCPKLD